MDIGEECKLTGDAELCVAMAAHPSSSKPAHAFFNRFSLTRIKQTVQRRRKKNAARVALAQEESHCKAAGAGDDDPSVCTLMPTTPVEIPEEYETATESMPSSSSTESGSESPSDSSTCVSSRIERMMQSRCEYDSAVQFEIEASKDHWSQLDPTSAVQDVHHETDLEIFHSLAEKWGKFFFEFGDRLVVGEKIAEGGQAEIFKAEVIWHPIAEEDIGLRRACVLKVFSKGWALGDLQKQWPIGMLQGLVGVGGAALLNGTMLEDGRFAFRMEEYWGDLRKLIDFRMQQNGNRFPPFENEEVERIVGQVARGMGELHKHNIVHRDLKASNVLINSLHQTVEEFDPGQDRFDCEVADFECSVGVVGTGYWRAPEILHALQIHDVKPHLFGEKSDVYSFAMTCYEVLTGCIPFEGLERNRFDVVIDGRRPQLPSYVHPLLKTLLKRCWHADPLERPSVKEILEALKEIFPNLRGL
jgi:hypothetical protein